MDTYVRSASTWRLAEELWVRDGSTWRELDELWVRDNSTWRQVFSAVPPAPVVSSLSLALGAGSCIYFKGSWQCNPRENRRSDYTMTECASVDHVQMAESKNGGGYVEVNDLCGCGVGVNCSYSESPGYYGSSGTYATYRHRIRAHDASHSVISNTGYTETDNINHARCVECGGA